MTESRGKIDVPQLAFPDRKSFRKWLAANHGTAPGLWLVLAKKGSGVASVSYDEAVEEALCFGWIDSITKRLDDKLRVQKFTPRKPRSNWSASNRERFARLEREGLMTDAGRAHTSPPVDEEAERQRLAARRELAPFVVEGIRSDVKAWSFFDTLPPSHKRDYSNWISEAKREETRQRRLAEAIRMLREGQRLRDTWEKR